MWRVACLNEPQTERWKPELRSRTRTADIHNIWGLRNMSREFVLGAQGLKDNMEPHEALAASPRNSNSKDLGCFSNEGQRRATATGRSGRVEAKWWVKAKLHYK